MSLWRQQHPGGRRDRRGAEGLTLVELLVAMTISVVIGAMVLVTWFALSDSYANTVRRGKAGDWARFALARMEREIRDLEQPPLEVTSTEVGIVRARPYYIVLYTTFNKPGNTTATTRPRLVMYRLYSNGELWRFHDADGNGSIAGVNITQESWPQPTFALTERQTGEGGQLVAADLVNHRVASGEPGWSQATPMFTYLSYASDGTLSRAHDVRGTGNRVSIRAVEIDLLVDLNPGRSPIHAHLRTTAQIRNFTR